MWRHRSRSGTGEGQPHLGLEGFGRGRFPGPSVPDVTESDEVGLAVLEGFGLALLLGLALAEAASVALACGVGHVGVGVTVPGTHPGDDSLRGWSGDTPFGWNLPCGVS